LDQTEEIAEKAVESLMSESIEKSMAAFNGIDLRENPEPGDGQKDSR
jgi:hypothetical protein